ncbi:hypothetical protein GBAR_LOCUS30759 [Geodia barretti]|uniref:Uncharacterized protein n=1 Tax=Geodia barretti TaxID=519541 RepID=A0AA35XF40_GEOBA|nr:hypothetical protein GBAR_LOCUS30759 [Geodia barretti]
MEDRIFGRSKEKQEQRERAKAAALLHCERERAVLRHCFRSSWFGFCWREHRAFWECFTEERERQLLLEQQSQSSVPDHHWSDTEQGQTDTERGQSDTDRS